MYDKSKVDSLSRIICLIVFTIIMLIIKSEYAILTYFAMMFFITKKDPSFIPEVISLLFTASFLLFLMFGWLFLIKIILIIFYAYYYFSYPYKGEKVLEIGDYRHLIRFSFNKKGSKKVSLNSDSLRFIIINLLIMIVGIIVDGII